MLIDIGRQRLFLESAGSGSPTVVLEAGAGSASDTWDSIWGRLAEITSICRYDRPNLGQSAAADTPRTVGEVADDLRALLRHAEIPGPYIMVGHSLGGLVVRLFAKRYPREVVGAVLVDSSHPQQSQRSLDLLPPQVPEEQPSVTALRDRYSNPEVIFAEGIHWSRSLLEAGEAGGLGDMPLAVLTRALPSGAEELSRLRPGLPPDVATALERLWQTMQQDLARLSTVSTHLIAARSSHYIHHEQPDLVVEAVHQIVEAVRGRRRDF